MLDQEAMQIARTRLTAESSRRSHFFIRELQKVQSELAIKGLGHSGALVQAIADVCAKEIEEGGERLWGVIQDLLRETTSAPSDDPVKVLHRQIDELWIPYCTAEPERQFEAFCMRHGVSVSAKQATNFYDRGIGARMPIHSQVDESIRSLRNRLRASTSPGALTQNSRVFLSHAASDEHIALLLKAEIERRLPGVKVFCSSDPTDLPPGTKWSPEIQQALRDSTALIFVASERGLQRRWVWFECGTFWFSGKKIIPLCLGEVRKNALHPPLSELQAINGDESSDLKIALDVIAAATGLSLSDTSDLDNLAEKLKQLDNRAAAALSIASGWRGVGWNGMFLAYEGPYRTLRLVEDANFETPMQDALNAAGYKVALYDENNFAVIGDAGRFVQLTDRTSWRCRIAKGRQWLVARPA
jgi:hypothetical protein